MSTNSRGPVKKRKKRGEKPTDAAVRVRPRRLDSEDSEDSSESEESFSRRDDESVTRKVSGTISIKASDIEERKPALAVVNAAESGSEQSSESESGHDNTRNESGLRKTAQSAVEAKTAGQKDAARSVGNAGGTISKQSQVSEESEEEEEEEDVESKQVQEDELKLKVEVESKIEQSQLPLVETSDPGDQAAARPESNSEESASEQVDLEEGIQSR